MTLRRADRIAPLAEDWAATIDHQSILSLPEWLATDDEGRPDDDGFYLLRGSGKVGTGLAAQRAEAGTFPTNDPIALLMDQDLMPVPDRAAPATITRLRDELAPDLARCYPAAVSTLPGSYLPGLVGNLAPHAVQALLDELEAGAREWGCPVTSVLHVPDDSPLAPELRGRGYVGGSFLAQAQLALTFSSFEEYVASLPKRRRNKVRRELRTFDEAGLKIRLDEIGRRSPEMAALHAEQLQSYGHQVTADRLRMLLDRIEKYLAPWCRVLVAERGPALEAFALAYEYAGELHLKMTGFSAYAQEHFAYFVMSYYALIEYALRTGIHTIFYGPLSYQAKVVRGCTLSPRTSYVLAPENIRQRVASLAAEIDRYNRETYPTIGAHDR